jgi:elongation of very long chain fatty acids protein 6
MNDTQLFLDKYYPSQMEMASWELRNRFNYEYNYDFVFFFERKFYNDTFKIPEQKWFQGNWSTSIGYSAVYVIFVLIGQKLMQKREKFHLYRSLVSWNILLAMFSIVGAVRFLPSFVKILFGQGLEHSVCVFDYGNGVSACWASLFVISKLLELVDTFFIVLRKQKLLFLHFYHHATVLIYCWYSFKDSTSSGRWFIAMNYTVQSKPNS